MIRTLAVVGLALCVLYQPQPGNAQVNGLPLTITTRALISGGTNQNYSQTISVAGGAPPYSFFASGLPQGLSIGNSTGIISGVPTTAGTYSVTVNVADTAKSNVNRTYQLVITSTLTIVTTSIINGSFGQPYFQNIQAIGGTLPFTFFGTGLPPGLALTAEGNISGTPTGTGTFTVDVTVTDAKKATATAEYMLTVYTLPTISTASPLPAAMLGVPYSQTVSASGGLGPYSFYLLTTPAPQGLTISTAGVLNATFQALGSVTFTVQVIDANNNAATKTFTLTVNAPTQQLTVSPQSLQFTESAGGELPGPQNITLSGGAAGSSYKIQTDDEQGGTAPSWLKVTPASGSVPGAVHVSVGANTLPAGSYSARVRITVSSGASTSTPPPVNVTVSLNVTAAPPKLSTSPGSLRFSRPNPEQVLVVHNSGGGGPLNFTANVAGSSSFVTAITPSSGQTPAVLRVRANVGSPGAFRDSIHLSSSAGNADVPVSLFISNPGPALAVSQTGFRFQVVQGAGTSTTQSVRILDVGDSGTSIAWKADLIAGSDWLALGSATGTATPTTPGTLILKTAPGSATESVGGHYALIRVSATGVPNSPLYIIGVLDVAAAGTPAAPDPAKGGLFFAGVASGAPPAAQSLQVGTSSASPVAVTATASTMDGASWLSVVSVNNSASASQTAQFTVSANTSGLKPGVYLGEVDIAIQSQVRIVNVTLIVAPAGTILSSAGTANVKEAGGCVPSQLALTETGLVSNFSIPAGWPATLEMQLNDDCGSPIANGTVVASFSNGDPPITLEGDGQSPFYSATWQPGTASTSVAITLNAEAPGLNAATAQLSGGVNSNPSAAPSLVINGFLHNVNAVVGAPLAPGTVSQVYGTNLTQSPDAPSSVPLPVLFDGVQVIVGGLNAPLYYVSPTQLTVQIPSELTATNEYQAIIASNGAYTLPQPVDLVPLAPGVAAFSDGTLIAQHAADFSLVDSNHPARPGEFLIIYLVGLGPTSVSVPSGTPAPGNQLITTTNSVTVTIDGQAVQTPFVGLTPGGVGLYQINLLVPANARAGKLPVTVTENGVAANATTLLVQP